jgi:hypothetical protein
MAETWMHGKWLVATFMAVGLVALGYAVLQPFLNVSASDGSTCGSAWNSAHRDLGPSADLSACESAGKMALQRAGISAAAGTVSGAAGLFLVLRKHRG